MRQSRPRDGVVSVAPHPDRCSPLRPDYDDILAAHARAESRGERLYRDPSTGLSVLTRSAHLERGQCCDSGCRHCPWVDSTN
ncbi:MAG: hypothetical protein KGR42_06850 [Acidobacteria bacterium]|nr:hypothetical protein [Acidobacteriota bacterium]